MKANPGILSALLLALALSVSGCSTIVNGKNQSVSFQSSPSGATVTLNGAALGLTPVTTMIEKKSGQTLTFSKEGYKTYTAPMTTTVDPWFWGNILIGGLLGSTTDAASGAMHQYAPAQYMITLEPDGTSRADAATGKSKKDKAREFIILSYAQIMTDLSKGSGNYLSSLTNILEIQKADEEAAINRIKSISSTFPDISEFADQVSNAFIK